MKKYKEKIKEKTDEELYKIAELKGIENHRDLKRKELIKKLVDEYEKEASTTC